MDQDLLLRAALMSISSSSAAAAAASSVAPSHNTTSLLQSVFDAEIEQELMLICSLRQQQAAFTFGPSTST
jgi:hypothetical protein